MTKKRREISKFTYERGTKIDALEFSSRVSEVVASDSLHRIELRALGIEEIEGITYEFTEVRVLVERR